MLSVVTSCCLCSGAVLGSVKMSKRFGLRCSSFLMSSCGRFFTLWLTVLWVPVVVSVVLCSELGWMNYSLVGRLGL